MRIDSVKKNSKEAQKAPAGKTVPANAKAPAGKAAPQPHPAAAKPAPAGKAVPPKPAAPNAAAPHPAAQQAKPAEGDENFDYSDFEIEDESI